MDMAAEFCWSIVLFTSVLAFLIILLAWALWDMFFNRLVSLRPVTVLFPTDSGRLENSILGEILDPIDIAVFILAAKFMRLPIGE
ncbi:ORF1030 [White spot syndrome virus]|uniref:Wsv275 n=3 Tax=White spot syndrome virus TaxID=342409 RepID=Q8VAV3_WSSVS|nr:wsv275 [Shrimp white spot syndrome virus]AFX59649.1 wsv275 [White spot syndrome virus]AAL33278.1 wsv275 [Shrimp white spot syndrome virus]AAL89198.1 WSSV330 [Shrimp white spot syndrome virus]ATU83788.1 ORF1030 [White spot syndrome virus]AWQ60852.1 wsv275 [Shrimp white spot syndrome virus]